MVDKTDEKGNVIKDAKGKVLRERTLPFRFHFPMPNTGFKAKYDEHEILESLDVIKNDDGTLKVDGSEHGINGNMELLRNHPDLVTHIPEILTIWNANTDQKTIISYDQLSKR